MTNAHLLSSPDLFRSLIENIDDIFYITDPHIPRVIYVNSAYERMWEQGREALYADARSFIESILPEDRPRVLEALEQQKQGRFTRLEYRVCLPSGRKRWVLDKCFPVVNEDGRVEKVLGMVSDVTREKEIRHAVEVGEEHFRQLADSMPQIVWTAGPDGKIDYFNRRWYEFTGFSPEEEGQDIFIIHPDDRKTAAQRWEQSLKTGRPYEIEYRFYDRKSSEYRWQLGRALPIRNSGGEVIRWFGTCTDIHQHKKNERELEELTQQLERKVTERTRVLREQTEQLRLLTSQLAESEQRERKKLAELIHDHLQQLLVASRIKVDFLSRSDMDEKTKSTLMDIKQHLDEAVEASRSLTAELRPPILYEDGLIPALEWLASEMKRKHNLTVNLELDEEAEPEKDEVKSMLYHCIRELLFNVVKYAGVSEADLSVKTNDQRIKISVIDKGRGFDLQEFYRNSNQRFGLFSIREYLKVMGGSVRINSEREKGTKVDMILPQRRKERLKEAGSAAAGEKKQVPLRPKGRTGIAVLIADDHHIVREGIANLLDEQPGITVVAQASDGEEAIALAEQYDPEVIIMDLNMPKMNGLEVTRVIKKRSPHIQIIGLSIQEESTTAQAMKQAGAVAYFSKSGDYQKLIDTILSLSAA